MKVEINTQHDIMDVVYIKSMDGQVRQARVDEIIVHALSHGVRVEYKVTTKGGVRDEVVTSWDHSTFASPEEAFLIGGKAA